MPTDAGLVIFLHVPKAGGTTLLRVLERLYPPGHVALINPLRAEHEGRSELDDLSCYSESEHKALRLVAGHLYFGIDRGLSDRRCVYFTILRDPVERVVSDFRYIQRTPWHPYHAEVAGRKMTLADYVESGLAPMADNGQVRLLCGDKAIAYGGVTEAHVAVAMRHIEERFVVAGTLERYDETLIRLRREFGWGLPYYVRERVAGGAAPKLDEATRQAVENHNRHDRALYAWVREREESSIRVAGEDFERDLARLRRACARYGRWRGWLADPARRMVRKARRWVS